jgi:hypothetical protein
LGSRRALGDLHGVQGWYDRGEGAERVIRVLCIRADGDDDAMSALKPPR